jgi:formiminoglutamase
MPVHFKRYDKINILAFTHLRKYETKLGEMVLCDNSKDFENAVSETPAKYILFGIPEDIGVKANLGKGGADTAWFPFLESFLNIQSNDFLSGENIFIAGYFDFSDAQKLINVNAATDEEKVIAYRSFVNKIDDEVEEIVKINTQNQKIPIIIGGDTIMHIPLLRAQPKGYTRQSWCNSPRLIVSILMHMPITVHRKEGIPVMHFAMQMKMVI